MSRGGGGLSKEEYDALPKKIKIIYWFVMIIIVSGIAYVWFFY
jgi:hypothetical protein